MPHGDASVVIEIASPNSKGMDRQGEEEQAELSDMYNGDSVRKCPMLYQIDDNSSSYHSELGHSQ